MRQDVDIARNLKTIEWLKAEMAGGIASLLRAMVSGNSDRMLDSLSALIINGYLLGKRIGFQYEQIDQTVHAKLTDKSVKSTIEKCMAMQDVLKHQHQRR